MSDGASPTEDASSPPPDELGDLDEAGIARLAARVWGRFLGRNPELRDELDER